MKKQKEISSPSPSLTPSQAPVLSLKLSSKGKSKPPFPAQKKSSPESQILSADGSSIGTTSTTAGELLSATPSEIKTCSALLDLPFRAIHLAYKDIPALTAEELEYMAEPLADIFIDLDWMKWVKLKGAYIKLGWGLSIAVVSRVRAFELVKAERKKEVAKKASQDHAGGVNGDRAKVDDGENSGSGTMTPGRE